jgi:ABC-type maltose transport system permease subunit
MAAAAIVSLVPQLIFFLFAQKYIVKGLTLGAVKG